MALIMEKMNENARQRTVVCSIKIKMCSCCWTFIINIVREMLWKEVKHQLSACEEQVFHSIVFPSWNCHTPSAQSLWDISGLGCPWARHSFSQLFAGYRKVGLNVMLWLRQPGIPVTEVISALCRRCRCRACVHVCACAHAQAHCRCTSLWVGVLDIPMTCLPTAGLEQYWIG